MFGINQVETVRREYVLYVHCSRRRFRSYRLGEDFYFSIDATLFQPRVCNQQQSHKILTDDPHIF